VETIGATTPTLPTLNPEYTSSSPAQLPTPATISQMGRGCVDVGQALKPLPREASQQGS
jgi:hypothetical protein